MTRASQAPAWAASISRISRIWVGCGLADGIRQKGLLVLPTSLSPCRPRLPSSTSSLIILILILIILGRIVIEFVQS